MSLNSLLQGQLPMQGMVGMPGMIGMPSALSSGLPFYLHVGLENQPSTGAMLINDDHVLLLATKRPDGNWDLCDFCMPCSGKNPELDAAVATYNESLTVLKMSDANSPQGPFKNKNEGETTTIVAKEGGTGNDVQFQYKLLKRFDGANKIRGLHNTYIFNGEYNGIDLLSYVNMVYPVMEQKIIECQKYGDIRDNCKLVLLNLGYLENQITPVVKKCTSDRRHMVKIGSQPDGTADPYDGISYYDISDRQSKFLPGDSFLCERLFDILKYKSDELN